MRRLKELHKRCIPTPKVKEAEMAGTGAGVWTKKQLTPEEISALRQECASLKNQLSQAKALIKALKASGSNDKRTVTVNPTVGDK